MAEAAVRVPVSTTAEVGEGGGRAPLLTYVVSRWGEPTQTFVRREATAVVEAGGRVRVLSLRRPRPAEPNVPVTHVAASRVVVGAVRAIGRRPGAALGAVARLVVSSAPRNLPRQLAACLIGLAWSSHEAADADLVHAHFGWVSATAAWASARVTGRPYTVVLHAFELHTARLQDRFTVVPLREAATVFTIAERDADEVRRRWGIDASVLRMGVSDAWLRPAPDCVRRDPWLVLSVGSLVRKKGHADLVRAIARADARWRLLVIGAGPERTSLERLVDDLGLSARVVLAGSRSEAEVHEAVRRAAVFALASVVAPDGDRDGIPVALMEAMACRTPVLTTRVGAIAELVDGCGVLVPPAEPHALAAALDRLRDPALRHRLGSRGRARVEHDFRSARAGERLVSLARRDGQRRSASASNTAATSAATAAASSC